jgi:lysophospholipase L1-like esterase
MADDGVQDIVFIRYTDATGTLDPSLQGDKGFPTPQICLSGKVRCHSVVTTDLVPASNLVDGIHPSSATNQKIAMRVLELMEHEGIRR